MNSVSRLLRGEYLTLRIAGVFKSASNMLSTDTVITNTASAAAILGIEKRAGYGLGSQCRQPSGDSDRG